MRRENVAIFGCRIAIVLPLVTVAPSCDRASRTTTTAPTSAPTNDAAVTAAKAAEQAFHAGCDEWYAARQAGRDTSAAAKKIGLSYFDFLKHIQNTPYEPNNEWLFPQEQIAFAGSYLKADGSTYSFLVGKGQSGLRMSAWKRAEWSIERIGDQDYPTLPGHGFAASISLEPYDLFHKFHVSIGTRPDAAQDLFVIPYTIDDVAGTIELRRVGTEWQFHPDRGVVSSPMHWWKPFAERAATRPGA
jgi:hypothetical protein